MTVVVRRRKLTVVVRRRIIRKKVTRCVGASTAIPLGSKHAKRRIHTHDLRMTVVVRRRILHIGPKKVVITWCVAAVLQSQ